MDEDDAIWYGISKDCCWGADGAAGYPALNLLDSRAFPFIQDGNAFLIHRHYGIAGRNVVRGWFDGCFK